ncbi:MAG: UDP-N-acetylmuramoyl-L-alanyl-D-glutamate--2,6-diaminopimelate ligase [Desulfarculus sp.]|nr:UDP-N-acetylmuramoyl-L-alanyl-D-glutamate--2,6-diaminopimelate ligase [Desulfarculus sp.]
MRLGQLLKALEAHQLTGAPAPAEIAGLTNDSRQVAPGWLFAALKGQAADGHAYLAKAAAAGAAAALVERPDPALELCQIVVPDSRRAWALMCAAWFGQPSRQMTLVGITGTNGKTTTSYLIEAVLAQRGPVGVIGTVEVRYADQRQPAHITTPEPYELQGLLAAMLEAGVGQAVMEVSSHALDQRRADGIAFDAALFTNLSRDHLDYHGDLTTYFAAKRRLFNELLPSGRAQGKDPKAVVCLDDAHGAELTELCRSLGLETWTYGLENPAAMVRGLDVNLGLDGGLCRVVWPGGEFLAVTPLVGRYNLQNLLAAAALGLSLGLKESEVAAGLASLEGVPGRLQRVPGPAGSPAVFVDYAHSDDALTQALSTLRPLTSGRLFCVFGAGGNRDQGKRPLMGAAVGRLADLVVLTSDNPRSEDPLAIMAMIEPGLIEAGSRPATGLDGAQAPAHVQEPDRAQAIEKAIIAAQAGDVVLIAGKGHEDYQEIAGVKRHFDDREQAAQALAQRATRQGARHA